MNRGLGTLLGPERLLLVPSDLCATCFLELTRFPLQCAHLSERPTLLLMRLLISAEHVLVGVMVDLEEHCFPPVGWSNLGTGITFPSDSGTLQLFFKWHCMGLI